MKKNVFRKLLLAALIAALTLFGASAAMADNGSGESATVLANMNLRNAPSGSVIGSVPQGAQVTWMLTSGDWDMIIYNGVTGWIYGGNLRLNGNTPSTGGTTYTVKVSSGYLALRTAKAFDYSNEIGKLYTGDTVQVTDKSDSTYWYVYVPTLGKSGYVNKNYLYQSGDGPTSYTTKTVKVSSGYLALRTAKAFDYSNEIGKLYTGDTVQVTDTSDSTYWYVYAPSLGKYGYVNKNYLVDSGTPSGTTMYVRVSSGYLALRNAKAFDYNNEIGKLYTGDTVTVTDKSDGQYWYVYAPSLGKSGYVNKDYLYSSSTPSGFTKTVSVSSGYLALRNAKAFDYNNEIGKLYTGDTVTVTDTSDGQYWYVYAPSLGKSGYVNKDYLY